MTETEFISSGTSVIDTVVTTVALTDTLTIVTTIMVHPRPDDGSSDDAPVLTQSLEATEVNPVAVTDVAMFSSGFMALR